MTLNPGTVVGLLLVLAVITVLAITGRDTKRSEPAVQGLDDVQLLPADDVELRHVDARPGNLLVAVGKPTSTAFARRWRVPGRAKSS